MNVQQACGLLGYSKQAYYKGFQNKEEKAFNEYLILELIRQKRSLWKKGSGRGLLASLKDDFELHQVKIGRDAFFELLKKHGLLIKRKSRQAITTNSYHFFHRYPNKIKNLVPQRPNQVWVSDITYLWVQKEVCFVYLFLITDMYSRKIIGYSISENLKAIGAINALNMAIKQTGEVDLSQTIHHSDRGVQYCCYAYTKVLLKNKINISMTENSDPLENPIAERVNRTIKEEFIDDYKSGYPSMKSAMTQIPKNINFYNASRPHSSIERLTPNQAHKREGILERKWKNYKRSKLVKQVN